MMTDIFTSFDPLSMAKINFKLILWMAPLIFIYMNFSKIWITFNNNLTMSIFMNSTMVKQIWQTFIKNLFPSQMMITTLFSMIMLLNIWGICPYSFSTTTHLTLTMPLALTMWLALISSSFFNNLKLTIATLLPSGAPTWLNPFLIIIESVSMLVRPITLAFRLAANMSAGHIVMTLISTYMKTFLWKSMLIFILTLFINSFYILFELGVSMIQAFIFCLLLTLYSNDHQ